MMMDWQLQDIISSQRGILYSANYYVTDTELRIEARVPLGIGYPMQPD